MASIQRKLNLEIKKLELEVGQLKKQRFLIWISAFSPILIALLTVGLAVYTGYLGNLKDENRNKALNLQMQVATLQNTKTGLEKVNDSLHKENMSLKGSSKNIKKMNDLLQTSQSRLFFQLQELTKDTSVIGKKIKSLADSLIKAQNEFDQRFKENVGVSQQHFRDRNEAIDEASAWKSRYLNCNTDLEKKQGELKDLQLEYDKVIKKLASQ